MTLIRPACFHSKQEGEWGKDSHQLQQQNSNRSEHTDCCCESSVHHFTIIPCLSLSPCSMFACPGILQPSNRVRGASLIAVGGRWVMAWSNYRWVDTSRSIHNQTWLLTMDFMACGGQWNYRWREIFFSYSRKISETRRDQVSLTSLISS